MARAATARMGQARWMAAALVVLAMGCGGVPEPPAGGGGGGSGSTAPATDLAIRQVGDGQASGLSDEVFAVYRDEGAFRAFWSAHAPGAPAPAVDFATEMAAAVVLQRNTGGYRVRIAGARVEGGQLIVSWAETGPRPDDVVIQILTQPWAVVALPRRAEAVAFEPR